MAADPTISITVVMPTYRRTRYLRQALESALAQTVSEVEILVSDNTEDDAVERVVRAYPDPRIRYRRNPVNTGGAANFLSAVQDARGPVVASLHDDDYWEPDFLQRVAVPLVEDPALAMACCDFDLIDADGRGLPFDTDYSRRRRGQRGVRAGRIDLTQPPALAAVLVDGLSQPAYAAAFRRELVAGRTLPPARDPLYDLWINELVCEQALPILYVDATLTHYRLHPGSQTTAQPFLAQSIEAYRQYRQDPRFAAIEPEITAFLARLHVHQAAAHLRGRAYRDYHGELDRAALLVQGRPRQALRALDRVRTLDPAVRLAHLADQRLRRLTHWAR